MSFGTLIDRIEDELVRTDLTTQVKRSIVSAINYYEREPWWFLEDRDETFTTSDGQEFYGSADASFIPGLKDIAAVTITINSNRFPLTRRSYEYIETLSVQTTSEGQPQDYCYFANQLRLYPIPDTAYEVRVSYNKNRTTLSATTDTNDWVTTAEELIRCRAKWDLFAHVIREDIGANSEAEYMKALEREAYSQLRGEHNSRASTGIKPTLF